MTDSDQPRPAVHGYLLDDSFWPVAAVAVRPFAAIRASQAYVSDAAIATARSRNAV